MGHFSVKVINSKGNPYGDIGVMIDYGIFHGTDTKRTHSDGWVKFHNYSDNPGYIWVNGHNMGNHSLSDGKTYAFTV